MKFETMVEVAIEDLMNEMTIEQAMGVVDAEATEILARIEASKARKDSDDCLLMQRTVNEMMAIARNARDFGCLSEEMQSDIDNTFHILDFDRSFDEVVEVLEETNELSTDQLARIVIALKGVTKPKTWAQHASETWELDEKIDFVKQLMFGRKKDLYGKTDMQRMFNEWLEAM